MSEKISSSSSFIRSEPLIQIASHDFVTVFCCRHHLCDSDIIVSNITKPSFLTGTARKNLEGKFKVLQDLDHPFIRQLYGVEFTNEHISLYLEKCDGSVLSEQMQPKVSLDDDEIHRLFCQLVSVIRYLHESKNLIHRSLTLDNIYLDKFQNIQVSGFDYSSVITEPTEFDVLRSPYEQLQYIPPELIRGKESGFSTDIWLLGIILYILHFNTFPFSDSNTSRLCTKILNQEPEIPSGTPEFQNLIRGLLAKDPLQRFTISQVVTHPWVVSSRYSHYTDPSFYLSPKFRITPLSKEDIDPEVMKELVSRNIDTNLTLSEFLRGEKTERTMCYQLFRKKKIMSLLSTPEEVKQRINMKTAKNDSLTTMSQFRFAKETGANLAFARTPRNRASSINFEKSEIITSHGGFQTARLSIPKANIPLRHASISESFNQPPNLG